jgi:hypothetical protein
MSKANVEFLKRATKVSDNFSITLCENGFVVDVSGSDSNDDWINSKIVFNSLEDLMAFIKETTKLEKR